MKKVIVTEKPSVGRTYAKLLNVYDKHEGYMESDEYIITWCFGHLVEMSYPEKYDPKLKSWSFDTLPFLPEKYKYEIKPECQDQFRVIKRLYNRDDIDTIYYAGDSAREGVYIQMLVRQEAGHNKNAKELIVWADSQTDAVLTKAIREAKPISEYKYLIQSGYMRAIEDYVLGINLSRAFTLKYNSILPPKKSIDVGRVMTVVLGMIVKREREIKNFKVSKFYKLNTVFNNDGDDISCGWKANESSAIYSKIQPHLYNETGFKSENFAKTFAAGLGEQVKVENMDVTTEKKYAPSLFNLAELQATCSKLFKISPDKTLEVAQSLYEKQLTTYPRTDARVLSSAVADEIDNNIRGLSRNYSQYTDQITDPTSIKSSKKYVDDSKISDHYAIIPTGSSSTSGLNDLEMKIYDLIVRRFLSIFLPPAIYEKVSLEVIDIKRGEHFYTSGSALKEKGYLDCAGMKKGSANELPKAILSLKPGDIFDCKYEINEGETKPPSRYTSGSMILAMENAGNLIEDEELRAQIKSCGIGTSATRGAILEKLVNKGYIAQNDKTQILTPCDLGELIYDVVDDALPELLDPKMTAQWEQGLEYIATEKITYDKYKTRFERFIEDSVDTIRGKQISASFEEMAKEIKASIKDKPTAPKKSDIQTYLSVPFDDKEKVKMLGARWDGKNKAWYVPAGVDLSPFKQWTNGGKATTSIKKIYLDIPFDDKDEAKANGARWDGDKKKWFIMSNQDTSKFKKWM